MNQQEFINMVNQQEDHIKQQRAFRNLALAVAEQAHIDPNATSLIFKIGRGNEHTNIEALTGWVKRTYLFGLPWEYEGNTTLDDCYIKLCRKLGHPY